MKGISVLFLLACVAFTRGQVDECPSEQENDWQIEWLMRHEDCHRFYKCTHGRPVEYICPSDLYFNLETWQCDFPSNVDCTGRNDPALTTLAPTTSEPTTTTTPEPTTTTTTTPAPTTTTTTTTTPAPTTTTTTTTTPAPTTTTTTTTTPAPTTTTTTTTTPAPTTTTTTTTTPAPTTTTTTTTTPAPTTHAPECEVHISPEPESEESDEDDDDDEDEVDLEVRPNGCPVDPHIHWLLPNEEDCNLFYYCVWGEKVLRQCPPTLHFNPAIQVCDWPQNAGCTVSVNKHAEARRRLLNQILM